MNVSSTTNTTQASNPTQATGGGTLGQADFLTLLTAQLKAQDPMNPMDATAFTAQLAQFSSLEQLTNINTNLQTMQSSQSSLQNVMATSFIGKKVTAAGNTVQLNGTADMQYTLSGDAAKVKVSVYDASGALVSVQQQNLQSAGAHTFSWNGKDANGNTLPAGSYTFSVAAVDGAGQAVSATTSSRATVTGVSFANNVTYLELDNGTKVQLGDVQEIGGA
jgi:flagellar basal-body rod modification protein FlgD